jgi:hypothetical protein
VKGIQNFTNIVPATFQKGDNHNNAKIGWDHLIIVFSRTIEPEELIFT